MAVNSTDAPVRPKWPDDPFDPTRACLFYSDLADELVLYFGDRPLPSYVDWIDAPGSSDAAVLIGEDENGEDTGEVVGIQVDFLVDRASKMWPAWRVLAEPSPPPEAVARLVAVVADLFERYWTPPPIEEQLASLARAKREVGDDGDG